MKKIPVWLIIIGVFAILIASKYVFFAKKEEKAGSQGKQKNTLPKSVNYFVAKPFDFKSRLYSSGSIGALNEIEIRPEVAGKVLAIYFKEGEDVNKGAILAKINDADLQAQLQKVKLQQNLAEQKLDRLKKLLAINGVSQEEFDVQQNEVNVLKAEQALLNAQIEKTTIRAPFSGVVGLKSISEGAYVTNTQVIANLVQMKPLFIEFSIPERYYTNLKKGIEISFATDSKQSQEMKAKIYAIEPKVEEATKTIKARAMYDGNVTLYPGSFVKVFMDIQDSGNSVMVPTQAIVPVLKGQKVFIAKNGMAEEVRVITGIRSDDKIQVLEGIQAGDTVLTTGLLSITKGGAVKLLNAQK